MADPRDILDTPLHVLWYHWTGEDAAGHEVLLCINTGSELSDPNRFKFDSDEFYLKSPEEMERAFARWPGACENTLEVASRCNVEISMGNLLLPRYEVPKGDTLETYLEKLVTEGLRRRYTEITPDVDERARFVHASVTDHDATPPQGGATSGTPNRPARILTARSFPLEMRSCPRE